MKDKCSLKTKIQVCVYWLFKHGEGIMVNCGMCSSTKLEIIESKQIVDEYTSKYRCRRCGAIADNKEVWTKE